MAVHSDHLPSALGVSVVTSGGYFLPRNSTLAGISKLQTPDREKECMRYDFTCNAFSGHVGQLYSVNVYEGGAGVHTSVIWISL